MANKIKLLVLPLVAGALFFHNASHTNVDQAVVDQTQADQANVNLSDGATDNYWGGYPYGLYSAYGYNSLYCDLDPTLCGYGYGLGYGGYGLGYGGYGLGYGGYGLGYGGFGYGGRGFRHRGHHGHHRRHR